jgi:hypothetical protein
MHICKLHPQVIESHHTFLDRQVLLLRCCLEPLNAADRLRLARAGLRGSALGRPDVECNAEVPAWLKKWAALTLEFVELERQLLPGVSMISCCCNSSGLCHIVVTVSHMS